ncbi:MAG: ATP-binding protein [Planctomycetaceae bacterium]|nr:ATP-binding protein [Planctomycetaceae bacterium]
MLDAPECEVTPAMLEDVVDVLQQFDTPDLLAIWQQRRATAVKTEPRTCPRRCTEQLESGTRRRQLAADVTAQQASSRVVNTTLITGLVVLRIAFLLAYVRAGRKAIGRLQAEVLRRKSEQARNERLTEQLLQAQKLDALGTLAAGTAHDFNNTLQAILTLAERLRESLPDSSQSQRHVVAIRQAAKQGGTLTRGMLTFSGDYETEKRPVDLIPLVSEMQSMVRHMMPSSITMVVQRHDSDQQVLCQANAAQLRQVILNLVINAKDAMPNGGELRIDVHGQSANSDMARICVSDSGCGILRDVLPRVFEPFFTTKDRGQGTGLGLSMVHGIVEDHGGSVTIDSETDRGTTVQICLPVCRKTAVDVVSDRPSDFSAHGRRVLVVDDNLHF